MNTKHSILIAGFFVMGFSSVVYGGCGLDVNPVEIDANRDAVLSRDEVKGTQLAWVFDKVDTDDNGNISQMEYMQRCDSIAPGTAEKTAPETATESGVVEDKADRQLDRQKDNVDDRIDEETDEAADKAVDSVLDSIFD